MFSRPGPQWPKPVVLLCVLLCVDLPPAMAQPWRLPYASEPPFIPVLDLFGTEGSGLILGAAEVLSGLPAPVTLGNATFVPSVSWDGQTSDAFTRFRGDVLIRRGDLYIGRQAVGATLQRQGSALEQLTLTTTQLGESQQLQGQQLQTQAEAIQVLAGASEQAGQVLQQHSESLAAHGQAIGALRTDVDRIDRNMQNLGSGVAGSTALAAALTRMPMDLNGAPLACGVGTGGYSSRYAMALGCTVELTPALVLNGGGAYLFGGASNYGAGSLSNVAGALGLVYRFGVKGIPAAAGAVAERLQRDLALTKDANTLMAAELQELKARLATLEQVAQQR